MNIYKEKLSAFTKKNKKKIIIVMSSLWLLAVFNIPLILWAWEKYLQKDKIGKRLKYEHDIQQLFEQLWYPDHAQTLCIYDQDDIDLVHLKWSKETMENLLHQFWSMKEEIQSDTISIPWSWTSYKQLNKYRNYVKLESIYNCEVINKIQNTLQLNENETIVILSLLMNLWLSENVEESQAHDWSVRNIKVHQDIIVLISEVILLEQLLVWRIINWIYICQISQEYYEYYNNATVLQMQNLLLQNYLRNLIYEWR
jgi:hypothetical protein